MKGLVFCSIVLLGVIAFSCKNDNKKTGGEYNINNPNSATENVDSGIPTIDFEEMEYNFGTVIAGEKVSHSFVFKNNGKGNLIISNVKTSCGCTASKWTKEPVKPGETGIVEVVFDSANRSGKQTKTAIVYSNAQPNSTELVIHCDVIN
ncbi:MAG: DUF1573 domain-containing protein [Endomicrobiia bacterium]